jgi:thymidylate kinase
MNKKLLNDLKKNIHQILNHYNANLIQKCDDFKNFTGRDIDAFYKKKKSNKIFKNTIIINKDNNNIRLFLNNPKYNNFISLDVEELSTIPINFRDIFIKDFNKKKLCKHTKLKHLDSKSIIFYKLYKYFFITISSYDQLRSLKKDIIKLNKPDFDLVISSIKNVLPNQYEIIEKFIFWDIEKFCKNKKIKKYFTNLISHRHKKRKIFAGNLNFKNIFFSKKFIYALLFGPKSVRKDSHNPMPAFAVIGNDGSGKTTITEYIRKNFSKMDPLIFDMKASNPFFSTTLKIRNLLKKINKLSFIKNIFYFKIIISFIGEIFDLFDKYVKYKLGMAWADAGYGLTVFERYPTDRVRGEFPNNKNKFLPLEQFFPFPDGMIYLDVLPSVSINRKKDDNHTFEEMNSKRNNYLSLIKEFNEVKIVPPSKNINQNILQVKNYIFKLYLIKKNVLKKNNKNIRVKWNKNYDRELYGKDLNRSQKESFFE